MPIWNPWHGCHRISAGCKNCYVYRRDDSIGKDAGIVSRTADFDLPIRRDRQNVYKLMPEEGIVYTCMTSDFFLEDADDWRGDCWRMIRRRSDLHFCIITKRIHRFADCIPADWGAGYPNVTICCTCENQDRADYRIPIFLEQPISHRTLIHEPLLGPIEIGSYLASGKIEQVICGGESGAGARLCDYDWVLHMRKRCVEHEIRFVFKQTGAMFRKDGRVYRIERKYQHSQAAKAGIDYDPQERQEIMDWEVWQKTDLFERICASRFRSRFRLKEADLNYISDRGMDTIRSHAEEIIRNRLAPARIPNDGKQTPMRGHPVFLAQHACACCCRDCLRKWHGIEPGRELTAQEQSNIADILMEWIRRQTDRETVYNFLDEEKKENGYEKL